MDAANTTKQYLQQNGWSDDKINALLGQFQSAFTQTFQNQVGRAPTYDEINQFFAQNVQGQTHPDFLNPYQVAQSYVPSAFGQQIQQYQQGQAQQQQQQLSQQEQQNVQGLLNQYQQFQQNLIPQQQQAFQQNLKTLQDQIPAFQKQITDYYTTGQGAQQLQGSYNNLGLTPTSGAFQQGLGNALASGSLPMQESILSGYSIPQAGTAASLPYGSANLEMGSLGQQMGNPQMGFNLGMGNYQNLVNLGLGQQQGITDWNNQLNEFNMQSQLAQELAGMSQPSGFAKDLGYANAIGQTIGNIGQGVGGASQVTSYVCMELIKRGLLCESDMDDFHFHIMPAMFKKARAFYKYAMDGYRLVQAVNAKGLDWKVFKPLLFDRVMGELDPCKAVDLYADACHQLCISSDPSLWDGRVYRTSSVDSLPFLPLLFLYKPFREALWKCLRIKMLFVYDKPKCEVHYGSR